MLAQGHANVALISNYFSCSCPDKQTTKNTQTNTQEKYIMYFLLSIQSKKRISKRRNCGGKGKGKKKKEKKKRVFI